MSDNNHQSKVLDFIKLCEQYESENSSIDILRLSERDTRVIKLRLNLLLEKVQELFHAVLLNRTDSKYFESFFKILLNNISKLSNEDIDINLEELAKCLVDIEYINLGTASLLNIDSENLFDIVHQDNLSKIDPVTKKVVKRVDGKILKHESYQPLNLKTSRELWLRDYK